MLYLILRYVSLGWTARATLDINVQGVVVHARKNTSSFFNLNLTNIDSSSTVLYPWDISWADSAVPHLGQYGTTLCPL